MVEELNFSDINCDLCDELLVYIELLPKIPLQMGQVLCPNCHDEKYPEN